MDKIHYTKPARARQYIQRGSKVVLLFYKHEIFNGVSLGYMQSAANHHELDGTVFIFLDLVDKTDEVEASERFGILSLPQLVLYDGTTTKPDAPIKRKWASVTDISTIKKALRRFGLPVVAQLDQEFQDDESEDE